MPVPERLPPGEIPDAASTPDRPPSEPELKQILAGEDLLDEAHTIGRRIWTKVWRLVRSTVPMPDGTAPPRPDNPDGRPS
jgi:hypothetical protein